MSVAGDACLAEIAVQERRNAAHPGRKHWYVNTSIITGVREKASRERNEKGRPIRLGRGHLKGRARYTAGLRGTARGRLGATRRGGLRGTKRSQLAHLHTLIETIENLTVVCVEAKVEELAVGDNSVLSE